MNDSRRGSVRWIVVFWLFVLSAVAYLDRVNLSIAGRFLAQDFGLTNVQLGRVFSAFLYGYALFQAPAGRLADRFGPRWVLFIGVIWWGIFTALTGWLPSGIAGALLALLCVRFLLGVGEAVVYPASNRVVAKWIPVGERGIANGILFAGVGVGAGIATPFVTAVMTDYGWRWVFGVCAAIGTLAAIVWFWLGRNAPAEHPWVAEAEAEYIERNLPPASTSKSHLAWTAIIADRNVLKLTLSYATFGYAAYIFFSWFFIYLNTVRGLDLRTTSFYSMLPFLAMAVGSPLGGWISDRLMKVYGRRRGRAIVAGGGLGLAAIFIAAGIGAESAKVASVILAGGAGTLYLSMSSFWSTTADLGGSSAGAVSGVMNMGNQLAGALTSQVTPIIAERFGWSASFLVAAALLVMGAVLWIGVNPEEPVIGSTGAREASIVRQQRAAS